MFAVNSAILHVFADLDFSKIGSGNLNFQHYVYSRLYNWN